MLIKKACKFTENEVIQIRNKYQKIRLIKNQMKRIKKEIERRQRTLSDLRDEARGLKFGMMEEFEISPSALFNIGEGYSRREIK